MAAACLAAGAIVSGGVALPAVAQEQSVRQLEQDVRDLQRTVTDQARRLEALERGSGTVAGRPGRLGPPDRAANAGAARAAPPPVAPAWVSAARWAKLAPGASEAEVLEALGPPTSMRTSDDGRRRTLYYALEIGASGYLAGAVVLESRRVVEVHRPELR